MPNLFSNKTDMAIRLFTALRLEEQSLRLTIQEAATALATAYKLVSSRYVNRLLWLRTLLGHVDADAREATSRLLGITSSALSSTAALDLLSELTSTFDQNRPSRFENYHGLLCAIGYITAGCLKESYEALTHLLGDQNDLTQDLASQGMSIVYELGDASMKEQLVHALVNTLSGAAKKKRAIKLMEDSEVFQEGTIGNNPTGGKLSTYKELCSLANEMGQPDLIYKFMDLANYQAAINSKRGAAFGFSKIAKQAGEALQPHLHTLIPRLVRYQYDPDKNIQMHAGNAGIQTEKLESLRIAVAKDSPMVGVASFITLLVQKVMVEIKPYAAALLRLLYSAVLEEKSSAAKRAFASSCAAVLKYASPSQAQKLIEDTTSLHLGEKNAQLSAAILIKSYLSNAADILSGYNAVVLPVIFASRFDDDKDIGALYGELWEDIPKDSGMPSVILNAVCAACSRKSKLYREAAFSCLQQVHTAASECLLELSKLYRDFPLVDRKGPKFSGELAELCESEKSEQAKAFLKQCMDILKDFEDATGLAMEMD
ncbi:hypothetical protein OsJ_32881 [Oryza sativa Japonica Group]|uniref:Proteasome adapter and scaffold protein ECM29 HEAT-repeat domain-containing protein n=1 Tax=Oryza sativa subsp. japonica TaxID=39947 RepID=B9G9A6_ORYSJ|nr:hypothetical protein OsJ_32881 [Oryza sativa Japonica Group]